MPRSVPWEEGACAVEGRGRRCRGGLRGLPPEFRDFLEGVKAFPVQARRGVLGGANPGPLLEFVPGKGQDMLQAGGAGIFLHPILEGLCRL